MYAKVDSEGYFYNIMGEILNYKKDASAVNK